MLTEWLVLAAQGGDEAAFRDLHDLWRADLRRLALARLLIAPRPVWLLDEPAASLDTQGRELLGGLIDAHRDQGGIVIAAVHEALGPAQTQTLTVGA